MSYSYKGYEVLGDGTFISPFGNVVTWHDDKFIKLNIDGTVRLKNGLNILYEVYNGRPVDRKHLVTYRNSVTKAKTKENLLLIPKGGKGYHGNTLSDETAEKIRMEYGLNKTERRLVKNSIDHPTVSYRQLAKKYNVSINLIQRVINGNYSKTTSKKEESRNNIEPQLQAVAN